MGLGLYVALFPVSTPKCLPAIRVDAGNEASCRCAQTENLAPVTSSSMDKYTVRDGEIPEGEEGGGGVNCSLLSIGESTL